MSSRSITVTPELTKLIFDMFFEVYSLFKEIKANVFKKKEDTYSKYK